MKMYLFIILIFLVGFMGQQTPVNVLQASDDCSPLIKVSDSSTTSMQQRARLINEYLSKGWRITMGHLKIRLSSPIVSEARANIFLFFNWQSRNTKELISKVQKEEYNGIIPLIFFLTTIALLIVVLVQRKRLKTKSLDLKKAYQENIELKKLVAKNLELINSLERTQNYVAKELHDKFGNRLAGIYNLSEILKELSDEQNLFANDQYSKYFSSLMHITELLNEDVKDLAWANNTGNNMLNIVIHRLNFFIEGLKSTCTNKIVLNVNCDKNYELRPYWNRQILLILKEFISKTCEHSDIGEIKVDFVALKDRLVFTCTSPNLKYNMEELGGLLDIENLKNRAQFIGCNLDIELEPGKGGKMEFTGPLC